MGERNAVFSRAMKHLAEEEAMEEARAGEAVAAALNRMARRNRRKPSECVEETHFFLTTQG